MNKTLSYLTAALLFFGASVGLWIWAAPQGTTNEQSIEHRIEVQYSDVEFYEKGAELSFEVPFFEKKIAGYEVKYTFVDLPVEDLLGYWDTLYDGMPVITNAQVSDEEGALEKILFHPNTPGKYYVVLRPLFEDGGLGNVMLKEEINLPQLAYHKVAGTVARKELLPPIDVISVVKEGDQRYLEFSAPYSSIVSYDVRYAKEQLSTNDLAVFWSSAFCREDDSCAYFDDVTMKEGHRERILLRDLPAEDEMYTYGITYTLRTGETSAVSSAIHIQGEKSPEFGETFYEFADGERLYEAVEDVAVLYESGKPYLTWEAPNEVVEYYVVRYSTDKLSEEEFEDAWDELFCYESRNCLYYPKGDKDIEKLPVLELPNDGTVYTYGVRYKVLGQDSLSKFHEPVYVVRKNIQAMSASASASNTISKSSSKHLVVEDPSLPHIDDLVLGESEDSFLLQFKVPSSNVLSYQIHYVKGAVTRRTLDEERYELACDFLTHPYIRAHDSCYQKYLEISETDDGEVLLQFRKAAFPGTTTFFVSYYDAAYHKASFSNPVILENSEVTKEVNDSIIAQVSEFRLYPQEEAVVYDAYRKDLLEEDLSSFYPHIDINRAMLARYLMLSRTGRLQLHLLEYSNVFCDVTMDDWYAPYAYILYKMGVISGYNDGECATGLKFVPDNKVRRAEALKIIFSFYDITPPALISGTTLPEDVTPQDWYAPVMKFAQESDIIVPDSYGKVYPMETITYLEALRYILATQSYVEQR